VPEEPLTDTEEEILALSLDTGGGPMPKLVELMEMEREELQVIIDRLVERGLLAYGTGGYGHENGEFVYAEDWWDLTDAGRRKLGLGPKVVHRPPNPSDRGF
jgi:hypothetical protein